MKSQQRTKGPADNSMQLTALRAADDAERYALGL